MTSALSSPARPVRALRSSPPTSLRLIDDAGVRLGFGALALIAVALVTSLAGLGSGTVLVALLGTAVLVSVTLPRPMALLLTVSAWAIGDGFALNRFGHLTFTPVALQWLVVAVVLAIAVGGIADPESEAQR